MHMTLSVTHTEISPTETETFQTGRVPIKRDV